MAATSDNKDKPDEIFLRLTEARPRDIDRGYARMDPVVQKVLGLNNGDAIEIENQVSGKKTAALLMHGYGEDSGKGILRIDGSMRRNLKASIDERVVVRKIEVFPAESVKDRKSVV